MGKQMSIPDEMSEQEPCSEPFRLQLMKCPSGMSFEISETQETPISKP